MVFIWAIAMLLVGCWKRKQIPDLHVYCQFTKCWWKRSLSTRKKNGKMQILRCWPIYRRLRLLNIQWSCDYSITGLLKESLFTTANLAEFRDIRFRITNSDDHAIMVWLVCPKIGSVQKQRFHKQAKKQTNKQINFHLGQIKLIPRYCHKQKQNKVISLNDIDHDGVVSKPAAFQWNLFTLLFDFQLIPVGEW